jgi:hypothetical protein
LTWSAVLAIGCVAGNARAYTPGSAEVVDMVEAGLKYIASTREHKDVGGDALIGIALIKNDYDDSHQRVARAIVRVTGAAPRSLDNYSLSLSLIFLCELDTKKYAKQIQAFLAELYRRQREFGAWTYEGADKGDTSQSQYGILALWTVHHHGIDTQEIEKRAARACEWLMRTQDLSGGWGYHGVDAVSKNRTKQSDVRLSTTAAGLGSLYICGNILGLSAVPAEAMQLPTDLPALVPVVDPPEAGGGRAASVDMSFYGKAQTDGNRWMQARYKIAPELWPFYYLYALERYQSFRELAEGRKEDSPYWYNDGVNWLLTRRQKDGAFRTNGTPTSLDQDLATVFAILFLTRSTKKTLGLLNEGTLKGGIGLPSNESKMALHGGRIVAADVTRSLSELLSMLEDQETAELSDLINFSADMEVVVDDPAAYQQQLDNLRRMASHESYEVRHVAVRALAKTRDLDNVPALIYALSDPDPHIVREAEAGLRFVSRKLEGFQTPGAAKPEQAAAAISKWKEWYQSIRPDAEFFD